MSDPASHRLRRGFVWACGLALAAFLLVQMWGAIAAKGPQHRVKKLMPLIGAEQIAQPLSPPIGSYRLEDSEGGEISLSQLPDDTLIFVNFWATWCKPCRDELPSMMQLRRQLADRHFIMVAVSYDDDWGEVSTFFQRFMGGTPSPGELWVLRDPGAPPGQSLRERLGTTKLPDTYVIKNGEVLARFVNARNWTSGPIVEYFRSLAPPR